MKKFLAIGIFFLFLVPCNIITAQKIPDEITKAFHKGDVETLSGYFNVHLQINIDEKEYMCSKAQAKEIMRGFFGSNKPSNFSIKFEGSKDNSSYAIGELLTNNGNYRVNLYFRKFNGVYLIHLLKIERDDKKSF